MGRPRASTEQRRISGTASLGGSLDVHLVNGYTPARRAPGPHLRLGDRQLLRRVRALIRRRRRLQSRVQPLHQPHRPRPRGRSRIGGRQTTVQSSENPSNYGESVTFTATVTPLVSTCLVPSGQVIFFDGTTQLDTAMLVNGSAAFSTSTLTGGSHAITVQYNGDSNFSGSDSAVLSQTVDPIASQTALQSSNNPSYVGASVTFTATVSSSVAGLVTPTGEVEFFDGSTLLGTETLSGGSASYTTSSLSVGANQPIDAEYLGDSNYSPSHLTIQQTIVAPATITLEHHNSPHRRRLGHTRQLGGWRGPNRVHQCCHQPDEQRNGHTLDRCERRRTEPDDERKHRIKHRERLDRDRRWQFVSRFRDDRPWGDHERGRRCQRLDSGRPDDHGQRGHERHRGLDRLRGRLFGDNPDPGQRHPLR